MLRKIIPAGQPPDHPEARSKIGAFEGWLSIGVNLILFVVKFTLGLISVSIALIADAFHTLSDLSTSIVIVISARIAKKPSDMEHPYGHQRAEAIATIIIATLLFVTGIEVGKSAFGRILHPTTFLSEWWIIAVVFLTILIKELLAYLARNLGAWSDSASLKAESWHHHTDALTTLLVLVSFILARYHIFYLDGYVGVSLALFIMVSGYLVARESTDHLLGSAPKPEFIQKVQRIAHSVPLVSNVHDLVFHQYGNNKILSLHLEVPAKLSLEEAHEIAEAVEEKIEQELKTHATVHFEPIRELDYSTEAIRQVIEKEIELNDKLESFHKLRTRGKELEQNIYFDLVVQQGISRDEIESIRKNMIAAVRRSSNRIKKVTIKIEPAYPFKSQIS